MIRKKENKKNCNKGLTVVGSLFILFGVCIVCGNHIYNYFLDKEEDFKIEEFYKEQEKINTNMVEEIKEEESQHKQNESKDKKVNYVAVIKIPKLSLEKGLCSKGSSCNYVNRNIQILNEADYPDKENGNFILAGHSGTGRYAYLKNANKLEKDDSISIIYGGFEYKYRIVNIYEIEKTGTANIVRNKEKNTLTLVTCKHNTNKQIIIISELVERSEYNG